MLIEEQIKKRMNPEELCDILEVSVDDMVDAFGYEITAAHALGKFYFLEQDTSLTGLEGDYDDEV